MSKTSNITTGLPDLDSKIKGFCNGNLYIIGGRPGVGKTAFALTILHRLANKKIPVGMFSLEMKNTRIALRLLCMETKTDCRTLTSAHLTAKEWKKFSSGTSALSESHVFIDDTPSLSALEIKHMAMQLKEEHTIKLLIVDDLQLIQREDKSENRKVDTADKCRLLKKLTVELDIPVIVTSQLSRKNENRKDKRPKLTDFLYASDIEESADTIMLLYRPWVYTQNEIDKEKAEVIIAKNRSGPTGIINLRFNDKYARFES